MRQIIEALAEFLDGLLPKSPQRPVPVRVKDARRARPEPRDPRAW